MNPTARTTQLGPSTVGVASMVAPLKRALLRRPTTEGDFVQAGWRVPDPARLQEQHEALCELLEQLGVEVIVAEALPGQVDACYMYDSSLVARDGAFVLQSKKPSRQGEAEAALTALELAGVPILGQLDATTYADGGDFFWLDAHTLVAGRSYRTGAAAHARLASLLGPEGVRVERMDLPHARGPAHVLHLLSVISLVTYDLALVHEPLVPVPLMELLEARGIRTLAVDPAEYPTLGCNVLAVQPGVLVMVAGNDHTRRALEQAGCVVHTYPGSEISLKGDGGPTCLVRPIWRAE